MLEEKWESIEILSDLRAKYSCFDEKEEPYYRALSVAIKAIRESEVDTLGKIRAEIDHVTEIHSDGEFYIKNIDVKRIIDKYKAESEE